MFHTFQLNKGKHKLAMILYEFIQTILYLLAKSLLPFIKSSKTKLLIQGKNSKHFYKQLVLAKKFLNNEQNSTNKNSKILWLHVASAGELEQAIPIINTLVNSANFKVFLTYFSPSTIPFLNRVPGLIGSAIFPLDQQNLFIKAIKYLNISDLIFVRYDLWPQLIAASQKTKIKLHLLGATQINAKTSFGSKIKSRYKENLFKKFTNIFLISNEDASYFKKAAPNSSLILAGEPKWSRAKQRAQTYQNQNHTNSEIYLLWQSLKNNRKTIIFGSPHKEEHQIALSLTEYSKQVFIIYVPHEITQNYTTPIKENFKEKGINAEFLSSIQNNHSTSGLDCLIVDKIGFLAELYPLADLAVIGGGFDSQIHNTLESTAHSTPTLFGENVRKAKEAQILLASKAALGFESPLKMLYFIKEWISENPQGVNQENSVEANLAGLRRNAQELFAGIPDTSEIILGAFLR